ncbi:hypothetical protein V8D89_015931 [Ganoderma adspersum]
MSTTKPQQKSGDKSKQMKYEDLIKTPELVEHRESLVARDLLLLWMINKCDTCSKSNTDCVSSVDHGKVTCDWCCRKHWKCTQFSCNSRGEIKGKEKNIPWAVFNGVGHSIYKNLPKEYLLWVEACCRVVESSREASVVTVVWPKGIAAQGLTEYRYNPATLPKYNARKMLKCKIVKGAQLMSRLQNNDEGGEGDEDKELEGEAPEGDIAKEQDKEDVSEQAKEEMDDPDDSEGSAVDLMPCKRSSYHMSRIYKCRRIDSSPAVDDDLNVIQDYGDAGLTTNLELQAALDVPLYEDELTTLMNFHTEQSWPEITAEDTQEREEQPYNNTAHEEMAEQVEQMDAVSRQAGDGEQPMEKASAMNAPNILDINPAEYEVSAIDRDNQVFAMRIHGLRMRHQALLSEEMTAWMLHERIERTERALTNLLFSLAMGVYELCGQSKPKYWMSSNLQRQCIIQKVSEVLLAMHLSTPQA